MVLEGLAMEDGLGHLLLALTLGFPFGFQTGFLGGAFAFLALPLGALLGFALL